MTRLTRGTQIIYVPDHIDDPKDPGCERGFVTSVDEEEGVAWCRYWLRDYERTLRTRSHSERTPIDNLVIEDTYPQEVIAETLREIGPAPCSICKRDCRTAFPACLKTQGESL